jgi:hypothetical protein
MRILLRSALLACLLPLAALGQGQLLPPGGAPGPTMKTLDQVQPRIPIDADHTPGDASNTFIIKRPGSYYLTKNVFTASGDGIRVEASGVTIDLSGFQISGPGGSSAGIVLANNDPIFADNCTIKNGHITGFGTGLIGTSKGGTVANLTVSGCKSDGIALIDSNWQLTDCVSHDNGGSGFNIYNVLSSASSATLVRCSAFNNAGNGISASNNSALFQCRATANASSAASSFGIVVGVGSAVVDCVVASNATTNATHTGSTGGGLQAGAGSTIKNCTAQGNSGDGIQVGQYCTLSGCASTGNGTGTTGSGIATDVRADISGCTAVANKGDGIVFSGDSYVLNNHASKNGGAGFHDIGGFSRIDGNVSRENTGMGIQAGGNDTVVRNNSGANGGAAYGPTAGANWGPVGNASSTNPWTNF